MTALVCVFCAQPACTCEGAVDHDTTAPHCADWACVARCGECVAEQADAWGVLVADDEARCP